MRWEDRITADPGVLVGKPVIKGTRLAVEFVVELLGGGWSIEQVLEQYDHITEEDVRACLSFAAAVLRSQRGSPTPDR